MCTVTLTVTDCPDVRAPSVQVTGVAPVQPPWLAVAETSSAPAGTVSVRTAASAGFGPLLVTPMV